MGLCRQGTARLIANQGTSRPNPSGLEILYRHDFCEMANEYAVHRQQKSFAAKKIKIWLIIRDVQNVSEMISGELAVNVEL